MLLHPRSQARDGVLPILFTTLLMLPACCILGDAQGSSGALLVHKYSTRVVRTKYGPLRGVILHQLPNHPAVEAFLGVPYATPPLGSLRYMPPVTPSMWRSTRLADAFSPVCPQRAPDIGNRTEALLELPRGRLVYLEKLLPLLVNQSEDCLYLNIYVPRAGTMDGFRNLMRLQEAEWEYQRFQRNRMRQRRRAIRDMTDSFNDMSEKDFMRLYRLPQNIVRRLADDIRIDMPVTTNPNSIDVETKVLAALSFYATGSYQRAVGQDFNIAISQTMVSRSVREVTNAINNRLFHRWIHFPMAQAKRQNIKERFYQETGMPGVIGAVDCTHIAIVRPSIHEEHYINRKSYHSINVQAVCDYDMRYLNINARYPGSTGDAFIWRNSAIKQELVNRYDVGQRGEWLIGGPPDHLPAVVYVHGESYEWNSGNPYDGSVLASIGNVIVVTINFRLGVLGFLKTGAKGSAQGNFGLMDLVAGLHWLRENLPAFGGDPERITLMGHGTGAALANFIAVSPVAKELLHRVVMLSGSGLSPWALQRDPLAVKRRVAEQTGCHGDLVEDDLAPCLRAKPLADLLAVRVDPPRFLPGFAPFVDGTVLATSSMTRGLVDSGLLFGGNLQQQEGGLGLEMADFPDRDLLFGLTTTESYLDLSAQDLEFGFNESRRDRILRTYVRNAYYYHLNEIFSTLKNEYTDWERPVQNPLNVRDATLEVLSDGHTAAPLIKVGYLHTLRGGRTFFLHFHHQSGERDFPQRVGSVRGEDVPYVLGLPLVGGQPFFPYNYSRQDGSVSKLFIHYLANFARKGEPNAPVSGRSDSTPDGDDEVPEPEMQTPPFWDTYDSINQLYLELGTKPEMRNHYRGHKMSLWLNLIPQLHRPGEEDLSMRHHHFQEEGAQFYEGSVRPQTLQRPSATQYHSTEGSTLPAPTTTHTTPAGRPDATTECPPNATTPAVNTLRPSNINNNLLKKLASSHYQSYTTALTVTIAVGCFLLLLNILIFAGIYHQRDRGSSGGHFGDKKKEELVEAGSCSSSSGEHFESKHSLVDRVSLSSSQQHLHASVSGAMMDMPLQEFKSSPTSGVKRMGNCTTGPPSYVATPTVPDVAQAAPTLTSPSIPEPPPPPKTQPPACSGILRQQGCPQTPGTMKKRVQIQEISV